MPKIIPIPIGPIYNEGPCRGMVHVIEKGDTLYRLGKRYHVSVGQLMFANPFVNVYNLQVGDELCIPISIQPRNPESRMQGEFMDDTRMPGGGIPEGMEPESRISGRMRQGQCQTAVCRPRMQGCLCQSRMQGCLCHLQMRFLCQLAVGCPCRTLEFPWNWSQGLRSRKGCRMKYKLFMKLRRFR